MPPTLVDTVLLVHAGATLIMLGVIWVIQVVHYPLFAGVGTEGFADYEGAHTRRITWVVMPTMLVELGTAAILAVGPLEPLDRTLAWVGLGLVALVWASTALLQVPLHGRLSRGFDPKAHAQLVATNWIRTAAWSARGVLALALLR